jgi:hypothetical protein
MTLPHRTDAPPVSLSGLWTGRVHASRGSRPVVAGLLAILALPTALLAADPAVLPPAPARGGPGITLIPASLRAVDPREGTPAFPLIAPPDLRPGRASSRESATLGSRTGSWSFLTDLEATRGRFAPSGLPEELLSSMQDEARRFRSAHLYDGSAGLDPADSVAAELRSNEAQRIMTRAFNRTLDRQANALARSSAGVRSAIDWLQDFGSIGRRDRTARTVDLGPARAGAATVGGRLRTSVGLRLGAHPELAFSAGFGNLRGRLELPLMGEPVRLSLERPLGPRGHAVFTSGLARDGGDWAALGLNFSF